MPAFTETLGSSRPGGLDIAFDGLAGQRFQDFEVVFVDGLYHERHELVLEAWDQMRIKQALYHVPNHRYGDGPWNATCAGYNTGFALASADTVVMLMDYAWTPPDWLERHLEHRGKLVMGPHRYRKLIGAVPNDTWPALTEFDRTSVDAIPFDVAMAAIEHQRERVDLWSCFAEIFDPKQVEEAEIEHESCPLTKTQATEPYWFSTKNESFPLENILKIGGMSEVYDLGRGPGDPDLGYRLAWSGLEPWYVHEAMIECLNPRRILPNMNIVIPETGRLPAPYDDRWGVADGNVYYDRVRVTRQIQAVSPVNIDALRSQIWHWRKLSQAQEAVIPRRVIPDEQYFSDSVTGGVIVSEAATRI